MIGYVDSRYLSHPPKALSRRIWFFTNGDTTNFMEIKQSSTTTSSSYEDDHGQRSMMKMHKKNVFAILARNIQ